MRNKYHVDDPRAGGEREGEREEERGGERGSREGNEGSVEVREASRSWPREIQMISTRKPALRHLLDMNARACVCVYTYAGSLPARRQRDETFRCLRVNEYLKPRAGGVM